MSNFPRQVAFKALIIIVTIVIVFLVVKAASDAWRLRRLRREYQKNKAYATTCDGTGGCKSRPGMLPVMDSAWALHEVVGQCLALEDHLNTPGKRCEDCIQKHFLFCRVLAEETVSLQKHDEYTHVLVPFSDSLRRCQKKLFTGEWDARKTARALRASRKGLMPYLKDVYGSDYVGIVTDDAGEVKSYNKEHMCSSCK